jgi:hypothetical protein
MLGKAAARLTGELNEIVIRPSPFVSRIPDALNKG